MDQLKLVGCFLAREPNESSGANGQTTLFSIENISYVLIDLYMTCCEFLKKPDLAIYGRTTRRSLLFNTQKPLQPGKYPMLFQI